ncbi:MAG: hypothetical protein KDD04_07525, partial [Sinomicrobium sp.]|nr:hypothetical protein [Sinomicrobium sp.]
MLKAFSKLQIAVKLPLIMIFFATLNAGLNFAVSDYLSQKQSVQEAEDKLFALKEEKAQALNLYLSSIEQDLAIMATNSYVRQALYDYMNAWYQIGLNQKTVLQKAYIDDNPNEIGQKEKLDSADDGSEYSAMHAKYHPWFRHFLQTKGYYDIFLIAPNGDIVYTVFKERDYATNVMNGEWKDSDIGVIFRDIKEHAKAGYQAFTDFKAYAPSNDVP